MDLRKYQIEAIEKIRRLFRHGKKRVILQASCGAGKTIIAGEITRLAVERGKKVLFLVNRRDLVRQTVDKYIQFGLSDKVGFIMAGEDAELNKPIQCATLQTYGRRLNLVEDIELNHWFYKADMLIYDEVHSCSAPTFKKILDMYKDKYIIGLSATPTGANGTGLSHTFQEIVTCVPHNELVKLGFLVPALHYAPSKPDLKGIGMIAGDYNKKELGERVDKPKLIGDIFLNWLKIAGDRKTIIFAVNVKHSKHIRDKFRSNGINIEHIDAHTDDETRASIYNDFEHGDLQVITNCLVACEGSDLPAASCVCVARSSKVLSRWLQMAGRGARPYPGKDDYLLLDFAGCIEEHGFVDDLIEWSLDGKQLACKKKTIRKKEKTILTCDMCHFAFTGKVCPQCGAAIKDYGKKIEAMEADLVQVDKKKTKAATMEDKRWFYGQLEYYRREKGYAPGWAAHKFREKFGVWPNSVSDAPLIQPDYKFYNYIKHLNIKYAKRRDNHISSGRHPANSPYGKGL